MKSQHGQLFSGDYCIWYAQPIHLTEMHFEYRRIQ
jgi:hypothetical protein